MSGTEKGVVQNSRSTCGIVEPENMSKEIAFAIICSMNESQDQIAEHLLQILILFSFLIHIK